MTITLNGTTGIVNTGSETITGALTAASFNSASTFGFKNRIINGAMVIDQRNAGASVTPGTGFVYTVDRFYTYGTQASKFTVQQKNGVDSSASNYEASSTPAGFRNSTKITVASAFSPAATDQFFFGQSVEGLNISDLGFGTANAQSVTLSFWVKSSLTGQFSAFIENDAGTQSWVAPYTISVANTWQKVSITATGSVTGVWATNNTNGMYVAFSLGCGTNFNTTANSWQAGNYHSTSSDVVFVNNASATFYITGVQLETGTVATTFEYRPYGTELQLCQRYYEILGVNNASTRSFFVDIYANAVNNPSLAMLWRFSVPKRAAATVATIGTFNTSNLSGAVGVDGTPSTDSTTIGANPAAAGRAYFFNNANSGYYASAEL